MIAAKLVPVGYGIKKLQIMLTIVDDLVSVDTLIEERLQEPPINEYVQSCDIVAFNKICKFSLLFITLLTFVIDIVDYFYSPLYVVFVFAEIIELCWSFNGQGSYGLCFVIVTH